MSLLTITQELHSLELALLESGGEGEGLSEHYSSAVIAKEKKVDSYAAIIERCKSIEAEFKLKADNLLKISRGAKHLAEHLKFNLKQALILLGSDELAGEEVRFKLTSAQEAVEVIDEGLLPLEYLDMKTVYTPNKERIKEALVNGISVQGARLVKSHQLRTYPAKGIK